MVEDFEELQQRAQQNGGEPTQFMSLLESLEARVDLMAQMQHTRAAIQKRARAIEEMRVRQGTGNAIEDLSSTQQPPLLQLENRVQAVVSRDAAEHLAREN